MNIHINTIHVTTDIQICMTIQEIQHVIDKVNAYNRVYIVIGWPERRNEVPQEMKSY